MVHGSLLQKRSREIIIVLLLVALLLRQGLAVLLLGLLGLVLLAVLLWSRWALRRVVFERRLSAERGFVGDQITLTQRVSNRKLLGLPSLQIDELGAGAASVSRIEPIAACFDALYDTATLDAATLV